MSRGDDVYFRLPTHTIRPGPYAALSLPAACLKLAVLNEKRYHLKIDLRKELCIAAAFTIECRKQMSKS